MSSSTTTQYEALAKQIESILLLQNLDGAAADVKDDRTRRRLIEGRRKLATSLEQPRETLRRIGYSVRRALLHSVTMHTATTQQEVSPISQHPKDKFTKGRPYLLRKVTMTLAFQSGTLINLAFDTNCISPSLWYQIPPSESPGLILQPPYSSRFDAGLIVDPPQRAGRSIGPGIFRSHYCTLSCSNPRFY